MKVLVLIISLILLLSIITIVVLLSVSSTTTIAPSKPSLHNEHGYIHSSSSIDTNPNSNINNSSTTPYTYSNINHNNDKDKPHIITQDTSSSIECNDRPYPSRYIPTLMGLKLCHSNSITSNGTSSSTDSIIYTTGMWDVNCSNHDSSRRYKLTNHLLQNTR